LDQNRAKLLNKWMPHIADYQRRLNRSSRKSKKFKSTIGLNISKF